MQAEGQVRAYMDCCCLSGNGLLLKQACVDAFPLRRTET